MTLKKSSSKSTVFAVFCSQLYQTRMLLILMGMILAAVPTFLTLLEYTNRYWDQYELQWVIDDIQQFMLVGGLAPMIGLAMGLAVGEFNYLHKRQQLDFFHALPVKRADHFFGRILAALAAIFGGAAIVSIGQSIAISVTLGNQFPIIFAYIWIFAGLIVLAGLSAYMFTVMIMVLTATLWEMIFSLLAVSAAYPITVWMTMEIINCSMPINNMDVDYLDATVFSPLLTGIGMMADFNYTNPSRLFISYIIVIILQILFCGIMSFFAFRRRRSELAEGGGATRFKIVVRFVTAVMASITGSVVLLVLTNSYFAYLIGSVIGFTAAWLVMELLYTRTLRKVLRCLIPNLAGYGVFAVINILIAFGLIGVPKLPHLEDVNAVAVTYSRYEFGEEFYSEDFYNRSELVFTDSGEHSVNMGTFDDTLVSEGYALAKQMLETQKEMYFPYYPAQAGLYMTEEYWRQNNYKEISVGLQLYTEDEILNLSYFDYKSYEAIEDIYSKAKAIASAEDYVQSNPTLAFMDNFAYASYSDYEKYYGEEEYRLPASVDREVYIKRLKEAYLEDLYSEREALDEVADTERNGEYMIYFNSDSITLQGGILDSFYPAAGFECWSSEYYTPQYSETLTSGEIMESHSVTMSFYSSDFPRTCAVLDELIEAAE